MTGYVFFIAERKTGAEPAAWNPPAGGLSLCYSSFTIVSFNFPLSDQIFFAASFVLSE